MVYAALLCFPFIAFTQDKPAYRIFSPDGKEVSYKKMMKALSRNEIILFGELHNNPIAHWLALQVAKSLYESGNNLVLGMEMFESDDQIVLNEYLSSLIEEKHLLKEAKVWDNYQTDYKPLIEFAREKKLAVIASNIPRRYANLVYRKGLTALDSLPDESLKWIAPLPVEVDLELKGYQKMISEMGGHENGNAENLARSQAVKDATMAYFILQHKHPGNTIFHLNGAYHSQDGEGIIWYLKRSVPQLRIATIHVAEQTSPEKLEEAHAAKADFIICVPEDMTKTY